MPRAGFLGRGATGLAPAAAVCAFGYYAPNSFTELLAEARCCHSCRTELERNEPVPFRLTRNLQTFFTPFGVEGVFITGLSVAAMVSCSGSALLCSAWAAVLSGLEVEVIAELSMAGTRTTKRLG